MDVTPQELRDIEIRESFRGYHRDEVDELLERAAADDRAPRAPDPHPPGAAGLGSGSPACAAAGSAAAQQAPAPAPAPAPVVTPVPVPDSDVIQRTLILAQQAADEAVTEAQAKAAQLTNESEAKAAALVSEAESTARRIAESERRRIEAEIAQLGTHADALVEDVDALERFSAELPRPHPARDRGRAVAPLGVERQRPSRRPARPRVADRGHDVRRRRARASATAAPAPTPGKSESRPVVRRPSSELDHGRSRPSPRKRPESSTSPAPRPKSPSGSARQRRERGAKSPSVAGWTSRLRGTRPAAPKPRGAPSLRAVGAATTSYGSLGAASAEEYGGESLDDDAFFASLRDAVRDDEPLGPA